MIHLLGPMCQDKIKGTPDQVLDMLNSTQTNRCGVSEF